jgi:hypothetical protein
VLVFNDGVLVYVISEGVIYEWFVFFVLVVSFLMVIVLILLLIVLGYVGVR